MKIANVTNSQGRYSFIVQVYLGRHHLTHIWPVLRASYKSSWFTTPPLVKGNRSFHQVVSRVKHVYFVNVKEQNITGHWFNHTGEEIGGSLPAGINKYCVTLHLGESILVEHSYIWKKKNRNHCVQTKTQLTALYHKQLPYALYATPLPGMIYHVIFAAASHFPAKNAVYLRAP